MITKERFIPYRRSDVIRMCLADGHLSQLEKQQFGNFCLILNSLFHFELHKELELLKECYAPFNPDKDTRLLDIDNASQKHLITNLESELKKVLDKANYEIVSESDLNDALNSESLFKVKLQVDFSDFEEVLFFRRGVMHKVESIKKWFGLKSQEIKLEVYERVLVYVRFKEQQYFDERQRTDLFFEPGSTIIKLFRNVPKNDMEMLFPNTEVRMKPIDKLLIGVPTAVGGLFMLVTKLGATLLLLISVLAFWMGLRDEPAQLDQTSLIALVVGFGALGGFLWRQFNKYKNRKIQFMKQLAENLYFKNLDNNSGVFHHLIDSAEEEECKETILAYYHLLISDGELSPEELDSRIENWFENKYNCRINFEMQDAINKLVRLKLVENNNEHYSAKTLLDANKQMDSLWDNFFDFEV